MQSTRSSEHCGCGLTQLKNSCGETLRSVQAAGEFQDSKLSCVSGSGKRIAVLVVADCLYAFELGTLLNRPSPIMQMPLRSIVASARSPGFAQKDQWPKGINPEVPRSRQLPT